VIVTFANRETFNSCVGQMTPQGLDGLVVLDSGLWLYQSPQYQDGEYTGMHPVNLTSPAVADDGRCAVCHPFSEEEIEQMSSYWADEIASGAVEFHDALPDGWWGELSEPGEIPEDI